MRVGETPPLNAVGFRQDRKLSPLRPIPDKTIRGCLVSQVEGDHEASPALFRLNAEMYLESANVYDSLAEAYMARGDRELAIAFYQKALTLNPENPNAVAKPAELRGGE